MGWEIERRFLMRVPTAYWSSLGEGHHYRQGYIRNGQPSLRIRTGEPRGAVLGTKSGSGVRRTEVETVVPDEMAPLLMELAGERIIEKVRFKIGPWELDRFLGALEGLALMEIELDDESDPLPEPPEGIDILREVTDDNRFVSGCLARLTPAEQSTMVQTVYTEVNP
ncbi:MAG: adenylate cyclase [Gemmatimonadales bacterium]|jgi:CYTH domain-containing protein|nr:adenylate cyclase [Gemmatimonadales bacterium]MBT3497863.1 adenylate cyclase [Gemmatimonadales bacterium]MBT3774686.1 adenylate cyclase [Gemmatimonadales bacterium]MBT3958770.1 adenylate cyclase [Gemmatimonadales bacterium]MBT4436409.1 adenylate cyclase [Gemmatimonadales bacterium]